MKHARHLLLMVATLLCSISVNAQEGITDVSQLSNEGIYFISLGNHSQGATSWAIASGGTALQSSTELGIAPAQYDTRQLFCFVSSDGGTTRYLYHLAEGKYINKNGSLGDTPQSPVYFKAGAYPNTFVVYFDNSHFINVNGVRKVIIDSWSTADGGNSCTIIPVGEIDTEAEYTVTFYDWDGTVLKTETVKYGQAATAPANPVHEDRTFAGWDKSFSRVYTNLSVYATYLTLDDVLPHPAPRAELWYDFEGVGEKGFVRSTHKWVGAPEYADYLEVEHTTGISKLFTLIRDYYKPLERDWGAISYMEDLNRDGMVDISTASAKSLLSKGGEYEYVEDMLIVPNFDVNNDGRIDYLKKRGDSGSGYSVMVQQADGSFVEQFMQVVTEAEYEASFDPNDWYSVNTNRKKPRSPVRFSGVSLPSAPPRREANAPMMRAQGMNTTVSAPTRALDLNADGYVDLIDEKNGVLYYNGGDGRWIHTELGGSVMVADLNGDHIQDFIFPGQELWVAVYRGANDFEIQTLYENIQVDPEMYCYDFDRDGDVDILVTFSAMRNSTGYAYTMFFENDGTGRFTQLDEQDYGDNNLLFSNCQDLDGDGYYDLLAFRGDLSGHVGQDLVWLKGSSNKTFAQPESLVAIVDGKNVNNAKISVEDIDNDGRMDVWADVDGVPSYSFISTRNTAPTPPAKPDLFYSNGELAINWGDGSDEHTATGDLTYALRVGTTPGGDEILRAHANADGSRRNFLDGNMSKFHNYTLDLTQRHLGTIYVSIQAIDAQHFGSAWSEEVSVEHTGFFADFRVSAAEFGLGLPMTATAPAMPDGFTHAWVAEDGVCTGNGHEVEIIFNTAGEKTIIHTLTAADGTSMSHVEVVNVLPNFVDLNEGVEMEYQYPLFDPMADYNMDGYWDVASMGHSYVNGTNVNAICKGGEDFSFALASGIWNTGLTIDRGIWYDWDHNGAVDFLFADEDDNCYYLPHNGTSNMKAKQQDENLMGLLADVRNTVYIDGIPYNRYQPHIDFTHDGNYESFAVGYDAGNKILFVYTRQTDGSYLAQTIRSDADEDLLSTIISADNNFYIDINRDGFTDICALILENHSYSKLTVLVNKGNCEFETLIIPFDVELDEDNVNKSKCYLVDMNNDGYPDFLSVRDDGAPYILWNESNERFSAPYVLPEGELDRYTSGYNTMHLADFDNNGYQDIVTYQQDESLGDAGYGLYVHYFGEGGVVQQGFLVKGISDIQNACFKYPKHPWAYQSVGNRFETIHAPKNERPAAPSDVRAVQTSQGLLIEWDHAKDDATPGVQMRYNLSVKKKGASGAGAYIISPQNACNSNAAPIRDFTYITAKQYLVPITVLPVGEYEIQLQAIDLQDDWSVFTEPLSITVEELCAIDAPKTVCTDGVAQFVYAGTATTVTPEWNFDGAEVLSGSGYGPYELSWSTPGAKTVTLTLGDKVATRMIYVSESGADMILPTYIFNNTTTELNLPEEMKIEWYLRPYRNENVEDVEQWRTLDYYSKMVKLDGNKFTWNSEGTKWEEERRWDFKIVLTNDNDCDVEVTATDRRIYEQSDAPQMSRVTVNDQGQNVIHVDRREYLADKVRILKEANRRDQYVEIGVLNLNESRSYTDRSSNASTQSERYVLQAIFNEGDATFYSTAHQTSHLTINRGLTDNTWNLIWSDYEGRDVVGYNILRGASPDNMEIINEVSSRHGSYTDYAPDANAPYYAIEYVLGNTVSYAPSINRVAARGTEQTGRTNVVNSNQANAMVYAEKVSILSATNKYATTGDNLSLALYPEIMPVATTLRSVRWEIVEGEDLATISSTGILTAKNPNKGGTVTVQATTVDGTNITATRTITIAKVGEVTPEPEPEPEYTVTFYDWNGTVLKTHTVEKGQSATAPANPTREGYTFTGWDKNFTNVQSNLSVTATYTQNSQPVTTYTVKFCDWDGTVLKTQTVEKGQPATAPANPTREGYTFTGWDKDFTNVQSDLFVYAMYTQNSVEPEPEPDLKYTVEYHAGANGWIEGAVWYDQTQKIAGYTSPLYRSQQGKVEKLRFTVNASAGDTKYFCLSELQFFDADGQQITLTASSITSNADHNALNPTAPDGGGFAALLDGQTGTYFHSAWKNMPTEAHYIEVTLPNGGYDAFSFKMLSRARTIEGAYVYDQSHTFPGEMVLSTALPLTAEAVKPEPEPEPEPQPELDNEAVYYVSQPYNGGTSWAIAEGGSAMNINTKLGLTADGADVRQQFAFISNDGGKTHYLYHPAEQKYVNKDNTLGTTPRDPVYFMAGAYENTFVVYFDNDHVINTNSTDGLIINRWGPLSGWGMADGGNSCSITPVGKFDVTDIYMPAAGGPHRVQKVLENGTWYIILPDGSKYTMTGIKMK